MSAILRQATFEDDNAEYSAFVAKFKPKKTTDDCYTPQNIYDAVADWVAKKYGLDRAAFVRPFWPGGNYETFDYPDGCVVVDNPPFSILASICRFYNANGIRFFLFGPANSLFKNDNKTNYICAQLDITYENGAKVRTSFVTNMGEYLVESAPDLHCIINAINTENEKKGKKKKLEYPIEVLTAARCGWYSVHGTDYKLRREDALFIRDLDCGIEIFGAGFLLSERAAAERAAAERAAADRAAAERAPAERAELSPRERELQRMISQPTTNERNRQMKKLIVAAVLAVCAAGCTVTEIVNRGEEIALDGDGKPVILANGQCQTVSRGWRAYRNQHWMDTKIENVDASVREGEFTFKMNGYNQTNSPNLVALVDTSLSGAAMLATKIGAAIVTAGGSTASEGTGAAIGALVEKFISSGGDPAKATVDCKDGSCTVTDGAVTCTDGACYAK